VNAAQNTKQKAGGRWRLPLFQSLLPFDRSGLAANLAAGISLAAMNIPGDGLRIDRGNAGHYGALYLVAASGGFCCLGIVALPCGGV
jgi:hypothetical protein